MRSLQLYINIVGLRIHGAHLVMCGEIWESLVCLCNLSLICFWISIKHCYLLFILDLYSGDGSFTLDSQEHRLPIEEQLQEKKKKLEFELQFLFLPFVQKKGKLDLKSVITFCNRLTILSVRIVYNVCGLLALYKVWNHNKPKSNHLCSSCSPRNCTEYKRNK